MHFKYFPCIIAFKLFFGFYFVTDILTHLERLVMNQISLPALITMFSNLSNVSTTSILVSTIVKVHVSVCVCDYIHLLIYLSVLIINSYYM